MQVIAPSLPQRTTEQHCQNREQKLQEHDIRCRRNDSAQNERTDRLQSLSHHRVAERQTREPSSFHPGWSPSTVDAVFRTTLCKRQKPSQKARRLLLKTNNSSRRASISNRGHQQDSVTLLLLFSFSTIAGRQHTRQRHRDGSVPRQALSRFQQSPQDCTARRRDDPNTVRHSFTFSLAVIQDDSIIENAKEQYAA